MIVSKLYQNPIYKKKGVKIIWFVLLAILAITPYIYAILFSPVSLDGSYYLSMVERIRDGLVPYSDFMMGYTPVLFYITAFVKNVFSIGINYGFDLGFHFCFQVIVSFLLYKIALLLLLRKDYSYYVSIFYLLISFWITQYEFILEIPSLMWGLFAIYLAIRYQDKIIIFILVGCIASISFLTKQFGFGYFFLIIYLILFNQNRWKQLILFVIGYSIPLILISNSLPEITNVFLGNGYGTQLIDKSGGINIVDVLKRIGEACFYIIYRVPVLLVALGLIHFIPPKQKKYAVLLLIGMAGFLLQFVFAMFIHYTLYIIPFASLYIFLVLNNIQKNKIIFATYVFTLLVVFVFSVEKNYNRVLSSNHEQRNNQLMLAERIKQNIEPGKSIYIADVRLVDLYYPMNVKPTNMGYTFGLALTERIHYKQLHEADYILIYEIPDKQNFDYLNSGRVVNYLNKILDKTVIEKNVFFDKDLNKYREQRIILYRNRHKV